MLINTRYVVVRRWSLYFITLGSPSTAPTHTPRLGLISSSENYGQKSTWNINGARSRGYRWSSFHFWYLELQIRKIFFFSFSLLVCDCCITRLPSLQKEQRSRRVKIEIQRFSLLTNRIPLRSSEFRRYFPYFLPPIINETSLVNLCLLYVLCRRYQEKTVSFFLFFGLFFHHISHSTACPTRGRKRLHWARQKVINDRKTS